MKDQNPSRKPVGDAGRVSELLEALRQIEESLVNLQPKIPQACYPGHEVFIDNYVNPCIQIARAARGVPGEYLVLHRDLLLYLLDDATVRGMNMGRASTQEKRDRAWWDQTRANIPRWVLEEAEEEGRIQAPEVP